MTSRRLVGFALCLVLAAAAHGAADARGPTFYEDVLPILQENCQECHRPSGGKIYRGGVPMSLTTYEDARPWARAIVRQTASKEMPPWDASEHFDGVFRNERGLTDAEIATLQRWVETGAQPGRPEDGPEPVDWADDEGWLFPNPDLVLKMPEPYYVEDDIKDIYTKHRLVLTEDILAEDKWVQEIEFRRGSELVHHFNIFVKGPNDEETRGDGDYLGGATSGSPPHVWPEGYGSLLEVGDTLTFDLHYHKEPGPGSGGWDQSSIALKFATKTVEHPIHFFPISNFGFEIPARHDYWHDTARAHLRPGGHDPRHAPAHAHARPRVQVHGLLPRRQRRADPPRAGLELRLAGDLLVLRAQGAAQGHPPAHRHVVRQLPRGGRTLGLQPPIATWCSARCPPTRC